MNSYNDNFPLKKKIIKETEGDKRDREWELTENRKKGTAWNIWGWNKGDIRDKQECEFEWNKERKARKKYKKEWKNSSGNVRII